MLAYDLARWIKAVKYENIPAETVEAAKKCILDTLAVAVRGGAADSSLVLLECLLPGGGGADGSTAIGKGRKYPASEAALFNGAAAHSVEMDDFHREAAVHPGVVVVPAALAVAEETKAGGRDLIRAVVLGYEAMVRVGRACRGTPYDRGFHPTAICGGFGSAAAAGVLYGLGEDQLAHALGIAGSYTGGLLEYKSNGAWTKRLSAGLAARNGVFAARLAGRGFTGPDTIFEGRFGFLKAYTNSFDTALLEPGVRGRFAIEEVSFKPHSSCRFTHAPIDSLILAVGKNAVAVDEIDEIRVETHDMAIRATMEPAERKYRPQTPVDAQFSIPYCLALAALYGGVLPEYFSDHYLGHDKVLEMAARVSGRSAERFSRLFPAKNGSRVTVLTGRGSFTEEVLDARGDPENPLSLEDLKKKFQLLTLGVLPGDRAEALSDCVLRLEDLPQLAEISQCLR